MEKILQGSIANGVEKMTQITEFMDILCDTLEENCNLSYRISLEELNPDGGIYAEPGEGFSNTYFYDKSTVKVLPVLFLCRDPDQKNGMEQLSNICNYLQRLKAYPNGETFSWLDTEIAKEPNKIGRDEDGVFNLSCILNCKIFF